MQGSHGPDAEALRLLHRSVNEESRLRDQEGDQLEARVTAIEEVFAARWPRRWVLAARLRRSLRASVRHLGWVGPFADLRAEMASLDVHPGRRRAS